MKKLSYLDSTCRNNVNNRQSSKAGRTPKKIKPLSDAYLRIFVEWSYAAAIFIGIGVSIWWSLSNSDRTVNFTSHKIEVMPTSSITVKLLSDKDKAGIPTNHEFKTSGNEFKTLIINDSHRIINDKHRIIMMNADTTLSIYPFTTNGSLGCTVKLSSGRIYSYVEHNGGPFIVETPHGRAVITGTTFDMSVTDNSTTLVVSEGSIQFESEKGTVTVGTGQISEIIGRSAPTKPVLTEDKSGSDIVELLTL